LRDKDILAIQRGQLFDPNRPDDWERVFVVAEKKDQIIGLGVTDFSHELKRAFGVLRGVLPDWSVAGLGKAIVLDSMDRARKRGISKYQASCSIDNKITQIQMGQLGMRFSEAFYTLHLWL
jgi:GNAT superfamily N-acetyltransferase